ncbi:MAG TPA: serine protease [Kofleriaceae bacterium]|nr:serine protease [Kofleriaceae bacterium]
MLAVLCLAGAGCSSSSSAGAAASAPAAPTTMAGSVVQIRTNTGARGTGFAVAHGNHVLIVTAAHVVADASELSVLREQPVERTEILRTIYPDVRVRAIDFLRDLAVLEVPNLPAGTLRPLPVNGDRCAEASQAWGYPPTVFTSTREQGVTGTALSGTKVIRLNAEESLGGEHRVLGKDAVAGIVFTPALEGGNSGGPVVTADGAVVAITVMKSLLHSQGAAVCASELTPLLDQAVVSAEPDAAAMERFASDVLNTLLPFAVDGASAQAARDFLLPASIDKSRAFYLQYLTRLSPWGASRFGDLRGAFEQAFPGTVERVERLQAKCVDQEGDKLIQCIADIASLPMALALFRKPFGDVRTARNVKVVGEPKRVVQDPPEYEVALLVTSGAGGDRSVRVRLRHDYGRLWLVVPDPEDAFLAAVRGDAATPYVGTWVHQIDQGGEDGRQTSGTYELTIRQFGGALSVGGVLRVEHLAPTGGTFPCNNQRRIEVDYRATWTARPRGSRLALDLVSERKLHDAARCQVSDRSLELERRGEDLVVVARNGEPGYAGQEWTFARR